MSVNTPSEWELISRCRSGNPAAFEPLVQRHESRALALAEALLGDPDDAADAVQEAFVKAYRALERLREDSAFGPWFRSIVRNHCRDLLRSTASRGEVPWEEDGTGHSRVALPTAPATLEREELTASVRRALAGLSPEHREILVLKEMEGMSYAQIARETGIPAGTVASRLHHARERLRDRVLAAGLRPEGVDG